MAYAKAENMYNDPEEAYGELHSHWGVFTNGLVPQCCFMSYIALVCVRAHKDLK